jgi:mannuronan synthase
MQHDVQRLFFRRTWMPAIFGRGRIRTKLDDARPVDRFTPVYAHWQTTAIVTLAYAGAMWVLVLSLPANIFDSTSHVFILSIGVIGLWRYGWWFTHYVRCALYHRLAFPKMRKAAHQATERGLRPGHVYVLCTSYRTDPNVTYAV